MGLCAAGASGRPRSRRRTVTAVWVCCADAAAGGHSSTLPSWVLASSLHIVGMAQNASGGRAKLAAAGDAELTPLLQRKTH